jgi:D-arabinose 1-dehydrogenase-like Zn-dependent alcohol dehydrogenase
VRAQPVAPQEVVRCAVKTPQMHPASSKVEEALTRLDRGDVRYRFVLDLSDLG